MSAGDWVYKVKELEQCSKSPEFHSGSRMLSGEKGLKSMLDRGGHGEKRENLVEHVHHILKVNTFELDKGQVVWDLGERGTIVENKDERGISISDHLFGVTWLD